MVTEALTGVAQIGIFIVVVRAVAGNAVAHKLQ